MYTPRLLNKLYCVIISDNFWTSAYQENKFCDIWEKCLMYKGIL